MTKTKQLSLVVPAYQQEKTIAKDIKNLLKTLGDTGEPFEIIVIDDGSTDKTFQNAKKVKSKQVQVIRYEKNQGKGYAVRYGMLRATGRIIGFIDAGMDIDPESILMLLNQMNWYKADIIVGSKLHPSSQVNYPFTRRTLSWGYRSLTRFLFGFKIRDTQVGVKMFKRNVVKKIFPRLLVKKFAFDIEILAVAHSLGYTRIYEAPIKLTFKNGSISSRNFWKIILHMLWDTGAVFYRLKIIKYYDKRR